MQLRVQLFGQMMMHYDVCTKRGACLLMLMSTSSRDATVTRKILQRLLYEAFRQLHAVRPGQVMATWMAAPLELDVASHLTVLCKPCW